MCSSFLLNLSYPPRKGHSDTSSACRSRASPGWRGGAVLGCRREEALGRIKVAFGNPSFGPWEMGLDLRQPQ